MTSVFDTIVIGGGINGLSAIYHLKRLGCKKLGLIEQFCLGHHRGSSHGFSRIIRSAYPNAHFVNLMHISKNQEWPRLERDSGFPLIHSTPGCFYGHPEGNFEEYARATTTGNANVELLNESEAKRRFPQFRFENVAGVLHDHSAGVIAAKKTLSALRKISLRNGIDLYEETKVLDMNPFCSPIQIDTTRGTLKTNRLIITAGPWASLLVPFLKPQLTVARQTVGYFRLSGSPETYKVGQFPVWGNLGSKRDKIFYGLPQYGQEGIKIARHITSGVNDNPNLEKEITSEAIEDLVSFINRNFVPRIDRFLGAETCFYTNTSTENFILDLHPDNPEIAIGAGFSGHGFKFGPLTGRILAELVLNKKTEVKEFENARSIFAI